MFLRIDFKKLIERPKETENDLAQNEKYFKELIYQIRQKNEDLKKELDKITATLVKTCQEMEKQNFHELITYKGKLQTRIDKLASQIQDFKGTLQSSNDILVFDTSQVCSLSPQFEELPSPVCKTPEFTQGTFS